MISNGSEFFYYCTADYHVYGPLVADRVTEHWIGAKDMYSFLNPTQCYIRKKDAVRHQKKMLEQKMKDIEICKVFLWNRLHGD